ncbi:MAG TPA: caspase family protein [Nitrospirota bacterium]|nr:caspase family protein [Nitrospirota bacterium]
MNRLLTILLTLSLSACMGTPDIRLQAGGVEMQLTQEVPMTISAALSADGSLLAAGDMKSGEITLWDLANGVQKTRFRTKADTRLGIALPIPLAVSHDNRFLYTGGRMVIAWDLPAGNEMRTIGEKVSNALSLSSDGHTLLSFEEAESSPKLVLYEVPSGRSIRAIPVRSVSFDSVKLSPDGRYALTEHSGSSFSKAAMDLWNTSTGKIARYFKADRGISPGRSVKYAAFSRDGKHVVAGGTNGSVIVWDVDTARQVMGVEGHTGIQGTMSVAFAPDGKHVLSGGGSDGLVKLWDIRTGRTVRTFRVYDGEKTFLPAVIMEVAFSPDGKYIFSAASDASVRIWNASTGDEVALMVGFLDGEWLAITSEGYYNASERGAQYLTVKYEGRAYTVDQFYDVFYRPDIVAAKLRGEDIGGLATITMKDAIKSPPPAVEFVSGPSGSDQPQVKVCYTVRNSGGGIGEVRLFQNGKLIQSDGYYRDMAKSQSEKQQLLAMSSKAIYEDMRSVSIKGKPGSTSFTSTPKGDLYEDCSTLDAVPGENEVSVSAFNSGNTVQSPLKTVKFSSTRKPDPAHLYVLAIGIDQYKDKSVALKYAVKDAKDIEEKLRQQSESLYDPRNIHYILLTNEQATKAAILGKIDELAKTIRATDSFVLFVAGHGVLLQDQYYMLTHEYDGQVSEQDLISSNEIVEMSKKIRSLSQLFIFDTCHAGGVDAIVSGLYDARMSVLAKKMGLHIFASASSIQEAMDGYQGNGLFSHTLLQGLDNNQQADRNNDGRVSLVELGAYAKARTTDISKGLGHAQTPFIINFGKDSAVYGLK